MNEEQISESKLVYQRIPSELLFPRRLPKNLSGPFTEREKREVFLEHCRTTGIELAEKVVSLEAIGGVGGLLERGLGIRKGREDSEAIDILFANFAHSFAERSVREDRKIETHIPLSQDDREEISEREVRLFNMMHANLSRQESDVR